MMTILGADKRLAVLTAEINALPGASVRRILEAPEWGECDRMIRDALRPFPAAAAAYGAARADLLTRYRVRAEDVGTGDPMPDVDVFHDRGWWEVRGAVLASLTGHDDAREAVSAAIARHSA